MKLSSLLSLYKPAISGAKCAFSKFDLIRIAYLLYITGISSRKELSKKLEIGEGSIRTLLETLKGAGLVRISVFGCELTKNGKREVGEIFRVFQPIGGLGASELTFQKNSFCIVARNAAGRVASGVLQRDCALLAGASGATVLVFNGNFFTFPGANGRRVEDKLISTLRGKANFSYGDVVVLSFAQKQREQERGTWAAIATL